MSSECSGQSSNGQLRLSVSETAVWPSRPAGEDCGFQAAEASRQPRPAGRRVPERRKWTWDSRREGVLRLATTPFAIWWRGFGLNGVSYESVTFAEAESAGPADENGPARVIRERCVDSHARRATGLAMRHFRSQAGSHRLPEPLPCSGTSRTRRFSPSLRAAVSRTAH